MTERTDCAVILIGHVNKTQGLKSSYRGLGSIDFLAAARSVLVVGRLKDEPEVRVVAQSKSSLSPEAESIVFTLTPEQGFQWGGFCDATVDDVLSGTGLVRTKTAVMEEELRRMLEEWELLPEAEAMHRARELDISERTLKIAKKNLGIKSQRCGRGWCWYLPAQGCKGASP